MKVSVLTILAAATIATASVIPSCDSTELDYFSEYELSTPPHPPPHPPHPPPPPPCLRVCWPKKHRCPPGSVAKKRGRCWTCCKKPPHHPHPPHFEEEEFDEYEYDEFDELD